MNKTRTFIKKIIYKTFGEGVYAKAYAKGKIKDIKHGALDEKEFTFLPHFIHEKSVVLDIGANYGHYAIEMARLCPNGRVYAFEPIPFTFRVFETIKHHFKQNNVVLEHAAVSNQAGMVEMTLPLLDFGAPNTGIAFIGNEAESSGKKIQVKTLKLDDLEITEKVDFIKIDIEGHEPQAFEGMEKLISKNRPVILIEFSHTCLKRAHTNPSDFAHYLTKKLHYVFAQVAGDKLKIAETNEPQDGYYFLIPAEQVSSHKSGLVI